MSNDFSMIAGDNRTIQVVVRDQSGAVVSIAGATIVWKAALVPFGEALLPKPGAIVDGPAGRFDVTLAPTDTAALKGNLFHWAVITEASAKVSTVYLGVIAISPASDLLTVEMVKARFPEFGAVSASVIQMIIAEAVPQVGDTWIARDRQPAVLYLVAHLLAMEGEPGRSAGATNGATAGPVKRRKVGDVETEFAGFSGGGGDLATGYGASAYGQRYIELLRKNFPAVAVV